MDRGAWWASVHGIAKSWTRLKRLSLRACNSVPASELNTLHGFYLKPTQRGQIEWETVWHWELYSVLCGELMGRKSKKRRGLYM